MSKTEMVFILDRSGSMGGLEDETIGGYNSLLKKQREEEGEAIVTTILFDNRIELVHDRQPIEKCEPLDHKTYYVRGSTALLDAIGTAIQKTVMMRRITKETIDKTIFVITTDGMENASREFTYPMVKKMIEKETKEYGWEFLFLGANIDAVEEAGRFGIAPDRAVRYESDKAGTELNYASVHQAIKTFRESGRLDKGWSDDIKAYYRKKRG